VRVLHPASFRDDPTRLLRAVRYEARLGFAMDPDTEARAREAVGGGALGSVSGPRVRDELLDLLREPELDRAVPRLAELGLQSALFPGSRTDAAVVAGAAREARALGGDPALAALAALGLEADHLEGRIGWLGLPAGPRGRALRAARRAPALATALAEPLRAAQLHGLLRGEPLEALALARALGAPREPVERYLRELRDVRLEVTGRELIAAGVPPSPRLGRALEETLRRKLDGEVSGREEELRVALEVARGADGDESAR
jgi:tRNA nucleotidyltransferase (CCA-adding enzyme)